MDIEVQSFFETNSWATFTLHRYSLEPNQVLLIGLPSTLVLRNRYDSDPANRYSFDPATKADYS